MKFKFFYYPRYPKPGGNNPKVLLHLVNLTDPIQEKSQTILQASEILNNKYIEFLV